MTSFDERVAAQLHAALLHHQRVGIECLHASRGVATGGPEVPVIRLTIEDMAGIAARAAAEQ